MDLRSCCPFWLELDGPGPDWPPLTADAACDVAIIGGGITGALIAHRLTAAGDDCILLDRRQPGRGSTAASTSLVQYELDVPLVELAEKIGPQDAQRAYALSVDAVLALGALTRELSSPVEFSRRRSLLLAKDADALDLLTREAAARRRLGLVIEELSRDELRANYGIDRPGAIVSNVGAQLDVLALTRALLEECHDVRPRIFGQTAVTAIEGEPGDVRLATARGPAVRARHVVVATGYEAQEMLREPVAELVSTFAAATAPLPFDPRWADGPLVWETGEPYFYLRTAPGGRLLIGGEDEPFQNPKLRDALVAAKAGILAAKLRRLIPGIEPVIESAWAGVFGKTRDGLGYFGQSPEYPGVHFALAFGGNGITFATLFSTWIMAALAGDTPADARLFRFGR